MAKENLKLSKSVMINGNEVKEIPYDIENMTAQDKINATTKYKKDGNIVSVQELDPNYHLYLFAAAVNKADPGIAFEDVLRISAKDSIKAESIVRDFFFIELEDISPTDTSEQQ